MRQQIWKRVVRLAWVALLCGSPALPAGAVVNRAEPLEVPAGPPPGPDAFARGEPLKRLERSADVWREHGYRDLPHLAWAVLELAERDRRPELARRAREWAPATPGVQFEVATLSWSAQALIGSLGLVVGSFPGVVWIATVGLAALGLGCMLAAAVVVVVGAARGLPTVGHSLAHLWSVRPSAASPGALLVLAALSLVPFFGVGPVLWVAVLSAVVLTTARRAFGFVVVVLLALCGFALGPGLDHWAALATVPGPTSTLLSAWRIERSQPLPGDRALLEHRLVLGEATPIERLVLATMLKREGKLRSMEGILEDTTGMEGPLRARVSTLLGTAHLARGDVRKAIQAFEEARSAEESAAVLYNLAQARGRALDLKEQSVLFTAAKRRDPKLVSRAADYLGANVHRFLLELPIPIEVYLAQALRAGPDARLLAADVRSWMLGRRAPESAWLLLPLLAAIGAVFRIRGVGRCPKCARTGCSRCGPAVPPGQVCLRCRRLEAADTGVDPRVRRQEHERELRRRRALQLRHLVVGLGVPGSAQLLRDRAAAGAVILVLGLVGAALLVTADRLPPPAELGRLGALLPVATASVLIVPAVLAGLVGAFVGFARGSLDR